MTTGYFTGTFSLAFVRHQPKIKPGATWWERFKKWLANRFTCGGCGQSSLEEYTPDPADPLTYHPADGSPPIVLDQKFLTDRATIPRCFCRHRNMAPSDWTRVALVHDWLFESHHRGVELRGFHETNRLLYEMLLVDGVPHSDALKIRAACETFGRKLWNYHYDPVTGEPNYDDPVAPPKANTVAGVIFTLAGDYTTEAIRNGTHKART